MRAYQRGDLRFSADAAGTLRDDRGRTWRVTEEALALAGGAQQKK